jgi:hypothetical protein
VLGCDNVNFRFVTRSAFFVALARARQSLTMMPCIGGGGAGALPDFICGLPDEHTQAIQALAGRKMREFGSIAAIQDKLGQMAYARSQAAKKKGKS